MVRDRRGKGKNFMNVRVISLICGLWLVVGVPFAWAYEEVDVANGGTIRGTITLAGDKPRAMAFN